MAHLDNHDKRNVLILTDITDSISKHVSRIRYLSCLKTGQQTGEHRVSEEYSGLPHYLTTLRAQTQNSNVSSSIYEGLTLRVTEINTVAVSSADNSVTRSKGAHDLSVVWKLHQDVSAC
jgi:hypothetical protein